MPSRTEQDPTTRRRPAIHVRRQALGAYGEELAADHLRASGMEILARNYRCPLGEIDIVARDADAVVICEVKTRSGTAYGSPLEAVTAPKAARLRRLAAYWLARHDVSAPSVRVDVIGVVVPRGRPPRIEFVRGVA